MGPILADADPADSAESGDAGAAENDAGGSETDAGTPQNDAGTPPQDAGAPQPDAGTPPNDAGTPPNDAGTPPPDAGTPPSDAGTPMPPDAGTPPPPDAGTPAPPDAGTSPLDAGTYVLPSCLGPALPIQYSGQSPYFTATVSGASSSGSGAFLLDYGSTGSWIDLNGFSGPAPVPLGCSGGRCTFSDFDFFGSWGQVSFGESDFSGIQSNPPQVGIIGTDFLSVTPFTLDAAGRRVLQGSATAFCSDSTLRSAGFGALDTSGYFSSNLGQLLPLSTVISGGSGTVPNVPTVRLRVGGAEGRAQIDTGFDDSFIPHSININVALFSAIQAATPGALIRAASLDISLSTCVGVSEPVQAYRLAAGQSAELLGLQGEVVRADGQAVLFVKRTPAAARVCGGIGTWTAPAAQLAGSAMRLPGAAIFDPIHSRVWVPRQ